MIELSSQQRSELKAWIETKTAILQKELKPLGQMDGNYICKIKGELKLLQEITVFLGLDE